MTNEIETTERLPQWVIDHLAALGSKLESFDLTVDKIRDRGRLIDYPDHPDWIAFEVERHQAVLGDTYTPGRLMDIPMFYWPCYAFDPEKAELHEIDKRRPDEISLQSTSILTRDLDMSFNVARIGPRQYRYEEMMTNSEGVVSSLDELIKKAREMADELCLDSYEIELGEYVISAENAESVMREIREALREYVAERAQGAWEDAGFKEDEEDEEDDDA